MNQSNINRSILNRSNVNQNNMNQSNMNHSKLNSLKNSQNINQHNQTQAYSDFNKTNQFGKQKTIELCGCHPSNIVPIFKILLAFILVGALIAFILSIVGASQNGDEWLGEQPSSSYGLFVVNILFCIVIFVIALVLFLQILSKNFEISFKVEVMFLFIIIFTVCSLAGGIVIDTIDQSSSIADSCNQVYQKIWPSAVLEASQKAAENFCSQSCPCAYNQKSQENYAISGYFDQTGPVNAIGCKQYQPLSDSTVSLLKSLEMKWKCAGICEISNRYLFSDVNRGKPNLESTCFAIASQKLYPLRNIFLGGDFSIGLIELIITLFLLRLKQFLDRDDVRIPHGVKTIEQQKQERQAASQYIEKQNGSVIQDQSSIIKQDHEQSMYIQQHDRSGIKQTHEKQEIQENNDNYGNNDYYENNDNYDNNFQIENNNNDFKQIEQQQQQQQNQSKYVSKGNFHQPLSFQIPQQSYEKQSSIPKQEYKSNTVVPLSNVLKVNNPYGEDDESQMPQELNEQIEYKPYSDLDYQLERDRVMKKSDDFEYEKNNTFTPQNDFHNDQQTYQQEYQQPQQVQIIQPRKQSYVVSERKIEHPPVNNLFDDQKVQIQNRSNLNDNQQSFNRSLISNHPLSQLNSHISQLNNHPLNQLNMNRKISQNQSQISSLQSPIKRVQTSQPPSNGFSVLVQSGNQSIQNRNIVTPQLNLNNNDYSSTPLHTHNVIEVVKPKSNSGTTRNINGINLNIEGSVYNSSYQLNDLMSQPPSKIQNEVGSNSNKKYFSKINQSKINV